MRMSVSPKADRIIHDESSLIQKEQSLSALSPLDAKPLHAITSILSQKFYIKEVLISKSFPTINISEWLKMNNSPQKF